MPYVSLLDCGNDELDPHYCEDPCNRWEEHARISAGAWIHRSVAQSILNDPSNAAIWLTHIATKKIIVLPLLNGSFDGGAPKMVTGFGRQRERLSGYDFSSTVKDPVYVDNWLHYKSLSANSNYHFAYCTESQVHITSVPVTVVPKNPVTDSLDDLVTWEATVTWNEGFTPAPHPIPDGVFVCSNPEAAPVITIQPVGANLTVGGTITLSVTATGSTPLTYQWKKDGVNIAGATGRTYTKNSVGTGDDATYTVVVSNTIGSATSNPAIIAVGDIVFDTILVFTSAITDSKESVSGTVVATGGVQQFQFNKDTQITGLPNSMTILLSGAEVIVVDFPGDYLGHPFRYIHTDAAEYMGVFQNGNVNL